MKPGYFYSDERARQKQASRDQDAEDLRTGKVTREELHQINGVGRIFKSIKILHRPRFTGSYTLQKPEED